MKMLVKATTAILIVLASTAVTWASQDADEATAVATDPYMKQAPATYWDHAFARRDRLRARLLDAYNTHGRHHEELDDNCRKLISEMASWFCSTRDRLPFAKASDLTNTTSGSQDPLIYFCYAYLWDVLQHEWNAGGILKTSVERLQEDGYPPEIVALAASQYAGFLEARQNGNGAAEMHQLAVDSFVDAVNTGAFDAAPSDLLHFALPQIDRTLPVGTAAILIDRLAADKEHVPPYVVELMYGQLKRRQAWDARGRGFANTVDDEGWRQFAELMNEAKKHYVTSLELNPNFPVGASHMIEVAMAGHADPGENERFWLNRAKGIVFDWEGAHGSYRWSLRPRWGGSLEELYSFGLECAKTKRYDTNVPYQFIEAMRDISEELKDWDPLEFWNFPGAASTAYEVLNGLAADPSSADRLDWLRSLEVAIAWASEDYERAADVYATLGDAFDERAVPYLHLGVRVWTVIEESQLYGSPLADEVREAEDAYWDDELELAAAQYQALLDDERAADEQLQSALRQRLALAKTERALQSHEWTPVTFDETLTGWRTIAGEWTRVDDTTIRGVPGADFDLRRNLVLISEAYTSNQWEMKATIDLTQTRSGQSMDFGIISHFIDNPMNWRTMAVRPRADKVSLRRMYYGGQEAPAEVADDQPFEIHAQVWEEEVVIMVNGEKRFAGPYRGQVRQEFGNGLGFTGWISSMRGGGVLISNISIRGLDNRPRVLVEPGF